MGKRLLEIFIVVTILFHIIYFVLYSFYFESFCDKYSGKEEMSFSASIGKMAQCKDSLICETKNIEKNGANKISTWSCNKVERDIFTPVYYYNIFKDSVLN